MNNLDKLKELKGNDFLKVIVRLCFHLDKKIEEEAHTYLSDCKKRDLLNEKISKWLISEYDEKISLETLKPVEFPFDSKDLWLTTDDITSLVDKLLDFKMDIQYWLITIKDLNRVYYDKKIDVDCSTYWDIKDEVEWFKDESEEISSLFKLYESKIIQTYFIMGNRLLFTYKGIKYRYSLSSSGNEYSYIQEIKEKLSSIDGVSMVMYTPGYID